MFARGSNILHSEVTAETRQVFASPSSRDRSAPELRRALYVTRTAKTARSLSMLARLRSECLSTRQRTLSSPRFSPEFGQSPRTKCQSAKPDGGCSQLLLGSPIACYLARCPTASLPLCSRTKASIWKLGRDPRALTFQY